MRESLKQRSAVEAREIWDKRHNMVDMRRKNPALGDRADEELFIDRERPVRKAEPSVFFCFVYLFYNTYT